MAPNDFFNGLLGPRCGTRAAIARGVFRTRGALAYDRIVGSNERHLWGSVRRARQHSSLGRALVKPLLCLLLVLGGGALALGLLGDDTPGVVLEPEMATAPGSHPSPGSLMSLPWRTNTVLAAEPVATRDRRAQRIAGKERVLPAWVAAAILDLADDDVPGNAARALRRLSNTVEPVASALEVALDSSDLQQRQLAALLLQERVRRPSDRLLEVSLEGLRSDMLPNDDGTLTRGAGNEGPATAFLLRHFDRVRERVIDGLSSLDAQERFLCAYILGRGRCARALPQTCASLIEHLRDNRVRGDARMSADALFALGPLAMPHLLFAEPDADRQALAMLRLIESDIVSPPTSSAQRSLRRERHPDAYRHYQPAGPVYPAHALRRNSPHGWNKQAVDLADLGAEMCTW